MNIGGIFGIAPRVHENTIFDSRTHCHDIFPGGG